MNNPSHQPRWLVLWLVLFLIFTSPGQRADASQSRDTSSPGILLVGLKDGHTLGQLPALRASDTGKSIPNPSLSKIGVQVLQVPDGSEDEWMVMLQEDWRVEFVEKDNIANVTTLQTWVDLLPNDPDIDKQWALDRIGLPSAWGYNTGGSGVTIAFLDTGIQLDHEDLSRKLWINVGEIPANGLDDDGNGKVDDIHGWHFYHNYLSQGFTPAEDNNLWDDFGHGTHVAGIAAAETNNAEGIAGVSWGSKIMPVKVLDEFGYGWYSDIAAGIVYAVDNGAHIINLSLGGEESSETMLAAVEYANEKNVLVVASTGNTGEGVLYPAAYPPVMAVGASNEFDLRPSFSNYGTEVDLVAPGVEIYSTWYRGNYFSKSGTSMAVPHVSGVAALLLSQRPELSTEQLAEILCASALDIGPAGVDPYSGCGRLEAHQALSRISEPADLWINQQAPQSIGRGELITYTLTYGNHGFGDAFGVVISSTLRIDSQEMFTSTIKIGDLPLVSGPFTQTLSYLAPTAGITVTHHIEIGSINMDPNLDDNIFDIGVYILHKLIFPLVFG